MAKDWSLHWVVEQGYNLAYLEYEDGSQTIVADVYKGDNGWVVESHSPHFDDALFPYLGSARAYVRQGVS